MGKHEAISAPTFELPKPSAIRRDVAPKQGRGLPSSPNALRSLPHGRADEMPENVNFDRLGARWRRKLGVRQRGALRALTLTGTSSKRCFNNVRTGQYRPGFEGICSLIWKAAECEA